MRKINPDDFRVARRSTSRDINRRILLNLVREHQPISRADLARRMKVTRGVVSVLVNELLGEELLYEGATGEAARGRKPTFLHVRTQDRMVIAIDIRFSRTYLMASDFAGNQLFLEIFPTIFDPDELIKELAWRVRRILKSLDGQARCEGLGVVVPGMVNHRTGRIVNAPTLGWKDVELREVLAKATGLKVHIENAAKACALAQIWMGRRGNGRAHSFVHVSVSDGVGVGIVVNGELVRGHDNTAGEFGHVPLNLDGPPCMCGRAGCWEAYVSNIATLSRYFGRDSSKIGPKSLHEIHDGTFTINDLIARAGAGDGKAEEALRTTARYLGLGLAAVVNSLNPDAIFVGGEITAAWATLEPAVRAALAERTLTEAASRTPLHMVSALEYPRLRGAAALVAAPLFAAPQIA